MLGPSKILFSLSEKISPNEHSDFQTDHESNITAKRLESSLDTIFNANVNKWTLFFRNKTTTFKYFGFRTKDEAHLYYKVLYFVITVSILAVYWWNLFKQLPDHFDSLIAVFVCVIPTTLVANLVALVKHVPRVTKKSKPTISVVFGLAMTFSTIAFLSTLFLYTYYDLRVSLEYIFDDHVYPMELVATMLFMPLLHFMAFPLLPWWQVLVMQGVCSVSSIVAYAIHATSRDNLLLLCIILTLSKISLFSQRRENVKSFLYYNEKRALNARQTVPADEQNEEQNIPDLLRRMVTGVAHDLKTVRYQI